MISCDTPDKIELLDFIDKGVVHRAFHRILEQEIALKI